MTLREYYVKREQINKVSSAYAVHNDLTPWVLFLNLKNVIRRISQRTLGPNPTQTLKRILLTYNITKDKAKEGMILIDINLTILPIH